jgi:hypothetical protein
MAEDTLIQKLKELLLETAKEHHQAFIETDGEDTEWPLWYAGYLKEKIAGLVEKKISKSELIYLIVSAEKEKEKSKSKTGWEEFYADFIAERL